MLLSAKKQGKQPAAPAQMPLLALAGGRSLAVPTAAAIHEAAISDQVLAMSPATAEAHRMPISGVGRGTAIVCGEFGLVRVGLDGKIGVAEIADNFLQTLAARKLRQPPGAAVWVQNHYRWLVWSLASLERRFPAKCGGGYVTCQAIIERLHQRYQREVVAGERSHLKKVAEHGEQASRFSVLCVASVQEALPQPPPPPTSSRAASSTSSSLNSSSSGHNRGGSASGAKGGSPVLLLTDGWYSLKATLDEPLQQLLRAGKISVGLKLCVCGAEYKSPG
jgi:hypothetical protein